MADTYKPCTCALKDFCTAAYMHQLATLQPTCDPLLRRQMLTTSWQKVTILLMLIYFFHRITGQIAFSASALAVILILE
jgi:hypothetical protein